MNLCYFYTTDVLVFIPEILLIISLKTAACFKAEV